MYNYLSKNYLIIVLFLKVKWCQDTGISLQSHLDYVKSFSNTFYEQVKILIDKNQEQITNKNVYNLNIQDSQLLQEVLDHAYFCNETVEKFHGRTDLIDKVLASFNHKINISS